MITNKIQVEEISINIKQILNL